MNMTESQRQDKYVFKTGEYDFSNQGSSKDSFDVARSIFLQTVSNRIPKVSENLKNDLLNLYQKIPLFYFEADKKRRDKINKLAQREYELERLNWFGNNRPNWGILEAYWVNRPLMPHLNLDSTGIIPSGQKETIIGN